MKKQTFYMLVALVVACCSHTAHAQEGGDFLQKLAEPDSLGVRSEVKMHIGAEVKEKALLSMNMTLLPALVEL